MSACAFLAPPQRSLVAYRYPLRASTAMGARVTTAFRRAVTSDDQSSVAELRAATLALSATHRAEGLVPEQALVSLKRAIGYGTWSPSLVPPFALQESREMAEFRMYSRVFAWFIEGYFGRTRSS